MIATPPAGRAFALSGKRAVCAALALLAAGLPFAASQTPRRHGPSSAPHAASGQTNHYSPLTQINRQNVHRLHLAWTFDTGERGMMESSPLVVGRTLYGCTPSEQVFALNAATGKLLWKFDSGIKGTQPTRGLAYWRDGGRLRLLAGIMNYLYELDGGTGRPVKSFGENGRVDLRKHLRGDYRQQTVALTSPGVVYGNLIIVGFRAPETHPAPPGDIRAYDLRTGRLRWSFHTIPLPGEPGYRSWPKDAWKSAGAANDWAGLTLDAQRGVVFAPTGSAVDDFYGSDRVGNDLYADSLLALDARTGKLLWHFQEVHHDIWDRDLPAAPALVTIRRNGKAIDAVAQTSKQGYVFLLDRATGKSLFPLEEHPYPPSDVPGEAASPTQPRPLAPAPFARQRLTEDMLTERTPEVHAWAVRQFHTFRSGGQFVPLAVGVPTVVFPGFDGGAEWGGPAVDPQTAVLYVNANDVVSLGELAENKPTASAGVAYYQQQCAVCHGDQRQGSPPQFPSLVGIGDRLSDRQIADVIHNGKGRMPSFPGAQGDLLRSLLAFLKTGQDTPGQNPVKQEPGGHAALGPAAGTHPAPPQPGAVPDGEGARLYDENCAVCHGQDRSGAPPDIPALLGVGQRLPSARIAAIVHNGKGKMPPFPDFSDKEMAALLRYLGSTDLLAGSAQAAAKSEGKRELEAAAQEPPTQQLRYRFTGYNKFTDPDGYPAVAPPWGTLNAIDLNTGKYLWKIPFGEYPELAAHGLTHTGTENYGGPVVTASGLLFIGATIFDRKLHAYDSRTGELLWETQLPFGGLATPTTYMVDGRQYVVIAAGGGKDPKWPLGGVYLAYALPRATAELRRQAPQPRSARVAQHR